MCADSTTDSFSTNVYLTKLFDHLNDLDMLKTFLASLEFAVDQNIIPDSIFADFVLMARTHRQCQDIISMLTDELLKPCHVPYEIFRTDHLYIRVLKELMIQSLGNTLPLHLSPVIAQLNRMLTPHGIAECATALFKKLQHFRFPSETKAFFLTLASAILTRFPGHEKKGLSGMFFLRYLCPLIMTSPASFDVDPSVDYAPNGIQLAKLIQNLANGIHSSSKPEFLLVTIENQHLMEEFLQRLGSATNLSGVEVPTSFIPNLALISYPSNQCIRQFIDQVVESLYLYHEHQHLLLPEKWVSYSVSWRRYASRVDDSILSSSSPPVLPNPTGPSAPQSHQREDKPLKRHWSFSLFRRARRSASTEALGPTPPTSPLVFQRRSSSSALLSSPRSESTRLTLRLHINSATNILSSEEALVRQDGHKLLQILGKIAELFGELITVPELQHHYASIRRVLFEFSQQVRDFVDALNSVSKFEQHSEALKKHFFLMDRLSTP